MDDRARTRTTMSDSTSISAPSDEDVAQVASAENNVAQSEVETIELSPLSNATTLRTADAAQQRSGNSSSSGANQSRRISISWSIIKAPSISTFHSLVPKCLHFLRRHKTALYKHALKLVAVLAGLGAFTLAWISLKAPTKPTELDIQSLAAMNRTADGQTAVHDVLQESLNKIQEELANERKQLQIDRELLRNEEHQLGLQAWAAQRQFIKDCIEYQKVYDIEGINESYNQLILGLRNTT